MKKLRKQIKESFFNPILHLLPLLFFLVLDEFYGMNLAWKISFPVVMILIIYVYYSFNKAFTWHLIFTFIFMSVGLIGSIVNLFPVPEYLRMTVDKLAVLGFLIGFVLFRKQIQQSILRITPRLMPMSNNFNELYRVIWALFFVLIFYISSNLLIRLTLGIQSTLYLDLIRAVYLGIIVFLVVYEIIRVQIIRANLVREEWWPIVNENGKIVGSIQYITSLYDEKKYLHPIVRVLLIDRNMVFLQKRADDDLIFPGLWDTAISNHLRVGETIEQCIDRTAMANYNLKDFKYLFLSNYRSETEKEQHYAFLFVSCLLSVENLKSINTDRKKWWTKQQIEDNLEAGIFSKNFKIEFDLLNRSGLLEAGKCECNCRLKEVIYHQTDANKND